MDLQAILAAHAEWLARGMVGDGRANLSGANLRGANLSEANLSEANLSGANLRGANLSGANLRGANLRGANLREANLSEAYLREANLSEAYLRGANLSGANLRGANLRGAVGVRHACAGGSGHGEAGRTLLCVVIDGEPRFFCGCFAGSTDELREYISKGDEKHRASRTLAMEFCLALLGLEDK